MKKVLLARKTWTALAVISSTALALAATVQNEIIPSGIWAAKDGSATVEIAPCGSVNTYCATVINEVLEAGAQSQMGKIVVQGLKFDKKKGWRGAYLADGSSYSATAKFRSATEVAFKICAFGFLCETQSYVKK